MEIEQTLLDVIRDMTVGTDQAPLTSSDRLLEGRLDSLSVLRLVGFIEETFRVQVADDELVPENFENVESIAAFIRTKTEANS